MHSQPLASFDREHFAKRLLCGVLSADFTVFFGTIAPGQHTPKQSLDDGQIPPAALGGRADLLESPGAMTAFVSSSH